MDLDGLPVRRQLDTERGKFRRRACGELFTEDFHVFAQYIPEIKLVCVCQAFLLGRFFNFRKGLADVFVLVPVDRIQQ